MELIQLPFARLTFASVLSTLDTVVRLYLCLQKIFFNSVKIYFCPLKDLVLKREDWKAVGMGTLCCFAHKHSH